MKITLVFVLALFLSTQAFLFPATVDVKKCIHNLAQIRASYKKADSYQKNVISKVTHDDLKRVHPDHSEKMITLFLSGAMFNEAMNDEQVCNSYYAMFGPYPFTKSMNISPKKDLFGCVYTCLEEKYTFQEVLRILSTCFQARDPLECIAVEVGSGLFQCVSKCFGQEPRVAQEQNVQSVGVAQEAVQVSESQCEEKVKKVRAYFKGLETKESKKEFLKKIFVKINEKVSDKKKAAKLLKLIFFSQETEKSVCDFANTIFGNVGVTKSAEECSEKVDKVREHYKGLSDEEKKEFEKKVVSKLNEKYPNSEKKVKIFLAFALSDVKSTVVCKLYKRFFKSGESFELNNPLQCFYDCMTRFLTPERVLRIISVCQTDFPCYINQLQGPVLECAGECFNGEKSEKVGASEVTPTCNEKVEKARKYFVGLEKEEKKEFVKKLYTKLTEKYPNVDKRKVGAFIAALLFRRIPAERVCELYKAIFKPEVVESKVNVEELSCAEKVEKARKYFKELNLVAKKEFVKKLYTKLTEKYPEVSRYKVGGFIAALLFERVPAEKVCELYKKIFRPSPEPVQTKVEEENCSSKVEKAREHFKGLDREGKKEFIKKLFTKLSETYPNTPKHKVGAFIAALLFQRVPAEKVCELYKRIFKPKTESVETKVEETCPSKVEKAREHFKGLDREGKKEFIKKLFTKLSETYPNTPKHKVGAFIAALLFQRVPAEKVCVLYKVIFKPKTESADNKVEETCSSKVEKAREHFKGLDREAKKEFIKKLFTKLLETYPNTPKYKVGGFIAALLFQRVPAEKVCELYKRIFKPKTEPVETKTVENDECVEKVKKVREHFNGLSVIEKAKFARNVQQKLSEKYPNVDKNRVYAFVAALLYQRVNEKFVCDLYTKFFKTENVETKTQETVEVKTEENGCVEKVVKAREYFKSLAKEEKKEFVKKLYRKLNEKYPEVCKHKVGAFVAALLFKELPAEKICELYKSTFQSKPETKVEENTCSSKVEKAREYFKGLERVAKKEFVTKLFKKLSETYPNTPKYQVGAFIAALLFKRVPAEKVCELYKKIFRPSNESEAVVVKQVGECEEKVEKAREYFKGLDKDGKKEFVKKLYAKLGEKYPNVEKRKVAIFIGAVLYESAPAEYVCKLYKRLFKSEVAISNKEVNPEKLKCLVKCVKEQITKEELLSVFKKCQLDSQCYLNELVSRSKGCAEKCL